MVDGLQNQSMHGVVGQLKSAIARHGFGDVDQECMRHGIAGVANQRVDDLFGIVTGGTRIPQTQR